MINPLMQIASVVMPTIYFFGLMPSYTSVLPEMLQASEVVCRKFVRSGVTILLLPSYDRVRHKCLNQTKLIMKTKNVLTSILLVAALCSAAQTSSAGQRQRSGSFQNSRGSFGTFTQTISHQPGQYSRVTITSGGNIATVDKTFTRDGNTATIDGSRTGFDGKTSDWNKIITGNGNGTASVNGQSTRQNGKTIDTSSTVTKTVDGHTTAGTYSTSTGKSGNYSIDVVNADGTHTKTENVTGADGKTATQVVTTDKNGNTIDRMVATTGPNGQTGTHSGSITFNQ
jgi:hypothetical protein